MQIQTNPNYCFVVRLTDITEKTWWSGSGCDTPLLCSVLALDLLCRGPLVWDGRPLLSPLLQVWLYFPGDSLLMGDGLLCVLLLRDWLWPLDHTSCHTSTDVCQLELMACSAPLASSLDADLSGQHRQPCKLHTRYGIWLRSGGLSQLAFSTMAAQFLIFSG